MNPRTTSKSGTFARRFCLALLLLACRLPAEPLFAAELLGVPPGTDAPALVLQDLAGNRHDIRDYRGKVVLVNFWASWCQPCLKEMPGMQRLHRKMSGKPFALLAVNIAENKSTVWRFRKLLNIDFTLLLDSSRTVTRAWDVEVYPTSFLIDARGQIRYGVVGALEWDSESILQTIEALMHEQANAVQVTAVSDIR